MSYDYNKELRRIAVEAAHAVAALANRAEDLKRDIDRIADTVDLIIDRIDENEEDKAAAEPEGLPAPTLEDCVAAAQEALEDYGPAPVRAALEAVGAARVSSLQEHQMAAFLVSLRGGCSR